MNEEDREFWRQLSWLYPSDYVTELRRLVAKAAEEYPNQDNLPSVRELVLIIMEEQKLEAARSESKADAEREALAEEAAEKIAGKVLSALENDRPLEIAAMGPEIIGHLVSAINSSEEKLAVNARTALVSLTDGGAIDALCAVWAETRDPKVEAVLLERGYLASAPLGVRVLTLLKNDAAIYMIEDGPLLVRELLTAIDDPDWLIAGRARRLLLTMTNTAAIDALCRAVLAEPENERLRTWAKLAGYSPSDRCLAALYYVITGQWDKYYKLDRAETRPLLAAAYRQAALDERRRVLAAARSYGHNHLIIELLLRRDNQSEWEEITAEDWRTMIDLLADKKQWFKLYQLIFMVPAEWAAEITLRLSSSGWESSDEIVRGISALCPSAGKDTFVPDGRDLISLSMEDHDVTIECAAFHPLGRIIAGGCSDGRLRLWHIDNGQLWRIVDLHADAITAVAFTPDGEYLVTAGREGKVYSWRFPEVKWFKTVTGQPGQVTSLVATSPQNITAAATTALAARIWSWDGAAMVNLGQYPGSLVRAAALSQDLRLAAGGRDGKIRLYPLGTGSEGKRVWQAHAGNVDSICLASEGTVISTGSDDRICVWEAASGELVYSTEEKGSVLALNANAALAAIARDNKRILAVKQLKFTKPLATATAADLEHMIRLPGLEPSLGAVRAAHFVQKVLFAKFGI